MTQQRPVTLRLRASGALACFTRPECSVERVSYPWITPSAARAIFEAVLWKPRIRYEIREIQVLKPIRTTAIRRNEIGCVINEKKISPESRILCDEERQQRNTLALKDVDYLLTADLYLRDELRERPDEVDDEGKPLFRGADPDNHGKYGGMFERRLKKGQCFHRPYLGCREFAADVRPPDGTEKPITDSSDHGPMFYDFRYPISDEDRQKDGGHRWRAGAATPLFFNAHMKNGIIAVPKYQDVGGAV